jgi:hypothetical protein
MSTPEYYPYIAQRGPHTFMRLTKFISSRIHQMRAGKSYLAAHTSWNDDRSSLCPLCEEADEDFPHAILECPARIQEHSEHIPALDDIGPEAELWGSKSAVNSLVS